MNRTEFAARIDHTVLGTETQWSDVQEALDEALAHGMNACIPPCYVAEAASYAPSVTLVTVCGFPQGQESPESKEFEAECAWRDGAEELDAVVNVGRLQAGDTAAVREELERVVAAVPIPVKAIVEAPLLAEDELRTACELAEAAGVAYVKTSTGYSVGGATIEDVRVMAEYLPVKASGGVSDFETAVAMLDAGAERIGASAGVELVDGFDAEALR